MISALLYLRLTSLKNWGLSRVRRLRQPKYLIGAIVGAAYFWFFFLRRLQFAGAAPVRAHGAVVAGFDLLPLAFVFIGFGLLVLFRLVMAWVAPEKPGLSFTEAEIAFLFPAPITRNTLIHFKLLSAQFTILFSSLIVTLIANRWRSLGGNAVIHAVGWWVIFSTLNLHTTGAAFTVTRLIDRGVSRGRRRAVVIAVIAFLIGAVGYTAWASVPAPTDADLSNLTSIFNYGSTVANTGVLHWLLLPFKLVLGPFLSTTWREFFLALGPALLVMVAHYMWVLRGQTAFEEGSIAYAEKRSRTIAAVRAGNYRIGGSQVKARRGPFQLSSFGGRPEIAFLWKNLISTRPYLNHRTFLVIAGLIVAAYEWLSKGTPDQHAMLATGGFVALIMAGYTLLLGPQFARQDLRNDLANVDLLKTYPLRGWQVMLGELLTPLSILTGILWLALLAAALSLGSVKTHSDWLTPVVRATAAGCLAGVLPLVCLLQLMVPNAATLLFPSWAQTTRTRERGIDVMGQRLIFVAGQLLVIVLALLPALLLGVLLWFASHWLMGTAGSTAVAAFGAIAVLVTEVGLGLLWLGQRFEKFDLSNEAVK
jgi:ABC-2 type transport system permease protein